jgi:hypothetical protein
MKDPLFVTRAVFLSGSLILFLTGCGLKYTPQESLETLENARREAIEIEYSQAYKTRNKKYTPLTYGQLEISKPGSYRKLDSLYAKKYAQENLRMNTDALDAQIEIQIAVVFNDTNPVLYVETHWFELYDTIHEFIVDRISLNKANKILKVEQLDYFECPKALAAYARVYMLERPFAGYTTDISDAEIEFYTTYKEKAASLQGSEKQEFVLHTLRIMRLAAKHSTLSTDFLLRKLAVEAVGKADPSADLNALKYTVESILEEREGKDAFLHYRVTVSLPGSDKAPMVFDYDYYLRPLR